MSAPVITFLSDYGLKDGFVGVCHGVIARICPQARVIDVTHGVRRHDIQGGAVTLRGALAYLPVGVHVAIVDPGVGTPRRAVALALADDRVLVGPDNGLLCPAADSAGGAVTAVDIARSRFRLEPVSATFHGRDIFAPVAAWLASGVPVADVGEPLDPEGLVRLELPRPRFENGVLVAHAVYIDQYGNVQLDVGSEDLAQSGLKLGHNVELKVGSGASRDSHSVHYARTFADVGPDQLLVYEDANRMLALAVRHGSAQARLGLSVDDELALRPA